MKKYWLPLLAIAGLCFALLAHRIEPLRANSIQLGLPWTQAQSASVA